MIPDMERSIPQTLIREQGPEVTANFHHKGHREVLGNETGEWPGWQVNPQVSSRISSAEVNQDQGCSVRSRVPRQG